jgi:hypothetical protein
MPCSESYLDVFRYTELFEVLYSGQYALSSRPLNWQIVLFSDPLYRPWIGRNPERDKVALTLLNPKELPSAPAGRTKTDPSRKEFEGTYPGKYLMLDPEILQP